MLARLFMFQQVYFHKTERASEWMLSRILERVGNLTQDGTRLGATPRAITDIALNGQTTLGEYLRLDDATLWVALASWCDASDPMLADLCRRFDARRRSMTCAGEHARTECNRQARATQRVRADPKRLMSSERAHVSA